jgi:rhodanese-related sulfurtransferase
MSGSRSDLTGYQNSTSNDVGGGVNVAAVLRRFFGKPYAKVSAAEAAALIDDGALLLDVRQPHEWRAGHAPKARHVPLAQLPHRARELATGKPLITVCRSGHRSVPAAAVLTAIGHAASNLTGGMRAWASAGLPIVATGGGQGRVA